VEATGAALSLDKYSWSGLFYYFKASKLPNLPSYPNHHDGLQVLPIKCYEPNEAVKVVGVHQFIRDCNYVRSEYYNKP